MKSNTKKTKKIFLILTTALLSLGIGWYVYAATVAETFDNYKVAAEYTIVTGGALKLGEPTYTGITEDICNAIPGWYWYDTNGRLACWSKILSESVSWNKGVGDDAGNPGEYTCAQDVASLTERMEAVAAGEWYKIVSSVNDVSITSVDNGSAGYSKISALAVADCLDRTRDLCTGDGCLGADSTAVNVSLAAWASATGDKSALPYCAASGCDSAINSDYRSACEQNSGNDLPLGCFDGVFYRNYPIACLNLVTKRKLIWSASTRWSNSARRFGSESCSTISICTTSYVGNNTGFRVVVRP